MALRVYHMDGTGLYYEDIDVSIYYVGTSKDVGEIGKFHVQEHRKFTVFY